MVDGARLRVATVVNCTGPGGADRTPLGRALLADGLARPDPLHLGLDVDPTGRLVAADGAVHPRVATLGPVRRGRFWETTAVPEIRAQAAEGGQTIWQMTAPEVTTAPTSAARPVTMPALCAVSGCSIFIASSTTTRSPSATVSPSATPRP